MGINHTHPSTLIQAGVNMKNERHDSKAISIHPALTLGKYARSTIQQQYRSIVKREKKVLADENPEDLHDMRVGTRRLRTALQVFEVAIELPASASVRRIGALAKTLGTLRDLDVQMADLQTVYRPQVEAAEQELLDEAISNLRKRRKQAYAAVEETLRRSRYRDLKATYEHWLDQPQLTPLAQLPIVTVLPDLLSPLLSKLLLHPGWLISAENSSAAAAFTLHDLRKACKQARYQAESFAPFYGDSFQDWMQDVKQLQEQLGKLQDSHVLQELLAVNLPKQAQLPTLQAMIQQTQIEALSNWDQVRQRYLEPSWRRQLHQMVLEPAIAEPASPDGSGEKLPEAAGARSK